MCFKQTSAGVFVDGEGVVRVDIFASFRDGEFSVAASCRAATEVGVRFGLVGLGRIRVALGVRI